MPAVPLNEIVTYLDEYLKIAEVPDEPEAVNGLQVECEGGVRRLVACTDACQTTIEAAAEHDADLMLVHHGLFWGSGLRPLTGRNYRRIRTLLRHDIGLYAAHIPLDLHEEVGNNAELARRLGLEVGGRFGEYRDVRIGLWGDLEIERGELTRRLARVLDREPFVIAAGPDRCRKIGVVTGGGSSLMREVRDAGLDTFITGEGPHHTYFDAEEWGLNVFYAGHYATETLGVRALAEHLAERFELAWEFVDHPTGL